MVTALVIFARFPVPGRVKTRLAAEVGTDHACRLYAAFLADLVSRFRETGDHRILAYTPDSPTAREFFQDLSSGDFTCWPQPDGPLGVRLSHCFETQLRNAGRVIVIGSDAPNLPVELVSDAKLNLSDSDCVLGPATDGGYYLVGLRRPCPEIFTNIEWGGPRVLEQTVQRVQSAGISLHLLPPWYDVDTPGDLQMLSGHLAAQRAAGIDPQIPRTERLLADGSCG